MSADSFRIRLLQPLSSMPIRPCADSLQLFMAMHDRTASREEVAAMTSYSGSEISIVRSRSMAEVVSARALEVSGCTNLMCLDAAEDSIRFISRRLAMVLVAARPTAAAMLTEALTAPTDCAVPQ